MENYFVKHFGGWSDEISKKKFFDVIANGFVQLFFLGEDFVGYVSFNPEKNNPKSYLINDIHIVKNFQWRGYGVKILEFAVNKAVEDGCTQLKAFVFKDNPAVQFYTKTGFGISENVDKSNSYVMIRVL
jgi:GNAT superfamily N-acetyltransferase